MGLPLFFQNLQSSDVDPLDYNLICIDNKIFQSSESDMLIRQFQTILYIANKFIINIEHQSDHMVNWNLLIIG